MVSQTDKDMRGGGNTTTRNLQAPSLDLIEAMSMVNDMTNKLTKLRSAEQFTTVFQDAKAAAELVGVELKSPGYPRSQFFEQLRLEVQVIP